MAPSYGTAGDERNVIFGGAVASATAGMRMHVIIRARACFPTRQECVKMSHRAGRPGAVTTPAIRKNHGTPHRDARGRTRAFFTALGASPDGCGSRDVHRRMDAHAGWATGSDGNERERQG